MRLYGAPARGALGPRLYDLSCLDVACLAALMFLCCRAAKSTRACACLATVHAALHDMQPEQIVLEVGLGFTILVIFWCFHKVLFFTVLSFCLSCSFITGLATVLLVS